MIKRKSKFELMSGASLPLDSPAIDWSSAVLSQKHDGIRCRTWDREECKSGSLVVNTSVQTRHGKPIPNAHIRSVLEHLPRGFEGEIVCGNNFQDSTSGVMKREGKPDFKLLVFNFFGSGSAEYCDLTYRVRMQHALDFINKAGVAEYCQLVEQVPVHSAEMALRLTLEMCLRGAEGSMLTQYSAQYHWGKCGKSTPYLIKIKPFEDAEWPVLGFLPEIYGPTEDNTRLGLVGKEKDKLGKIIFGPCNGFANGFTAALSMSDVEAEQIWREQESYIGRLATVKYLASGSKLAPRHPNVLRFRHPLDLGVE